MSIDSISSLPQSFAIQIGERQEPHVAHAKAEDREHKQGTQAAKSKESSGSNERELDQKQIEEVQKLAARDREVRAHEAAHKAAGGSLTGPASFSYTNGPNGQRYASSGEVSIDTSEVSGDPQATLRKANQIRAAALAPTQPSNTDRAVAADAAQMAAEARVEILAEQNTKASDDTNKDTDKDKEEPANTEQQNKILAAYQTSGSNPPPATIDVLA